MRIIKIAVIRADEAAILKQEMEAAVSLAVPLTVEIGMENARLACERGRPETVICKKIKFLLTNGTRSVIMCKANRFTP